MAQIWGSLSKIVLCPCCWDGFELATFFLRADFSQLGVGKKRFWRAQLLIFHTLSQQKAFFLRAQRLQNPLLCYTLYVLTSQHPKHVWRVQEDSQRTTQVLNCAIVAMVLNSQGPSGGISADHKMHLYRGSFFADFLLLFAYLAFQSGATLLAIRCILELESLIWTLFAAFWS